MLIALNKPFGMLSQFTSESSKPNLSSIIKTPDVYPAGRLDFDSEGLLLLTDDGALQHRIADPKGIIGKRYLAQVEGVVSPEALEKLGTGVVLDGAVTGRAKARAIAAPAGLWERDPPIRYRAAIPTSWLELIIYEGRNRQVRRMTAAVGFPTLRLIRASIGNFNLFDSGLAPGEWKKIAGEEINPALSAARLVASAPQTPSRIEKNMSNQRGSNKY